MRVTQSLLFRSYPSVFAKIKLPLPIVRVDNGTFYRDHPSSNPDAHSNPPIFPGLKFALSAQGVQADVPEYWAIIGSSSSGKTTFLEILRGFHVCLPPSARSFPLLGSKGYDDELDAEDSYLRNPLRALQYVGFNGRGDSLGGPGIRSAYLSARYESRREDTDFSLLDYLKGNTSLNPTEEELAKSSQHEKTDRLNDVVSKLNLKDLLSLPVGNLSNGQTRRARIAKALMGSPKAILLDEPFRKFTGFVESISPNARSWS